MKLKSKKIIVHPIHKDQENEATTNFLPTLPRPGSGVHDIKFIERINIETMKLFDEKVWHDALRIGISITVTGRTKFNEVSIATHCEDFL